MWSKCRLSLFCLWMVFFCGFSHPAQAASEKSPAKVLVLYQEEKLAPEALAVANLTGHFAMKCDRSVYDEKQPVNLSGYDYIFYLNENGQPPKALKKALDEMKERVQVFWIGALEQSASSYPIIQASYRNHSYAVKDQAVYKFNQALKVQKYAEAGDGLRTYPLIVSRGNEWFYLSTQLWGVMGNIFADVLHDFFHQPHLEEHEAFIRIEDVHPATDFKRLREAADYLYSEGIPFMVAVIPVYYNPRDNKYITLDQVPAFKETLQYMVQKGGSIIMHGYSHQYYKKETGEGFEFWDIATDKPIVGEDRYIRDKLEKGIAMLVRNGLEPVAFEPPHYTMSQNGYRILSRYFSTLVGQLQISDDTFETSQKVPYRLQRDVNGLKIIPETMGYVTNDAYYMDSFRSSMTEDLIVRDSVIGAFYHSYLPVEKLKHFAAYLKTYPLDFIDLQMEANSVHTDFVDIQSGPRGIQTTVVNPQKLAELGVQGENESFLGGWFPYILWTIIGVVSAFSILFLFHLSYLKKKASARLFDERDVTG